MVQVAEKHLTLIVMDGPVKSDLEPSQFKIMVKAIRNIENALDDVKKPSKSELKILR